VKSRRLALVGLTLLLPVIWFVGLYLHRLVDRLAERLFG
jgi:hypothetical protein